MTDDRDAAKHDRYLPELPSRLVDREAYELIAAREDLARRLRVHDPSDGEHLQISDQDFDLLRQLALESNTADPDPWVRRHAISILGDSPSPENLNVLTLLSSVSDDVNVRAEALLALGRSGLALSASVLAVALGSRDSMESTAAARALRELATQVGPGEVLAALRGLRAAEVGRIREILSIAEEKSAPGRPRKTSGDDGHKVKSRR